MSTATLERNDLADTIEIGVLRRRRRLRVPVRFVRENPAFAVVFGAAAVLRLIVCLAYRPALLFNGDSYLYLQMSHTLKPDPTRPLVYPIFIRVLSWAPGGHNLMFLTAVQHLLGLAVGFLVYAVARRYRLPRWAATLAAAPILLDAYQMNIEHFVMAEVLLQALVVGAVALFLWDEKPSIVFCAGAGVLLGLAGLSRTVGLSILPVAAVFLLARRVGLARLAAFGVMVAVIMGGYSLWFGAARHGVEADDGFFLYGRVQSFADCTRLNIPANELGLCDAVPLSERPNANYYIWGRNTPAHIVPPRKGMTQNAMLRDFALRAISGEPVEYAGTVTLDFIHYFRPGHISGRLDEPGDQWRFPRALDHAVMWRDAVRLHDDSTPVIAGGLASFVRGYQAMMFPDGPIFAVLLLLGLAAPFLMWRRPGGKESALIVAIAIVLLAVPLMTTMFDYRYFLPAIPFLGLAGAFGLSAIWTRVPGTGARAALIGAAAIFVGCVSLAFALSAAPAKTAATACRSVRALDYGTKATRSGALTQTRTEAAYLQEMYLAAADRESALLSLGGRYRTLWVLMMNGAGAADNHYAIERACGRHRCGSRAVPAGVVLARAQAFAMTRIRLVHEYCDVHFGRGGGRTAKRGTSKGSQASVSPVFVPAWFRET